MFKQAPHAVLMIRPAAFGMNDETAASNAFQKRSDENALDIQQKAVAEFDAFVQKLKQANIEVVVVQDTAEPVKPDAIFPNNWISMQPDGTLVLYPMLAQIRSRERRSDIPELLQSLGYLQSKKIDLTGHEQEKCYLEGTGSIVFDHVHKLAYACASPRTNVALLEELCTALGYTPVSFEASDPSGIAIYHTNVLMHIGTGYTVICEEVIPDVLERAMVLQKFKSDGLEIISISWQQLQQFAGNMLEVQTKEGENVLVMSESAYRSLTKSQIERLEKYATILYSDLQTIESIGGGSARCMLAGIHWELS